MRSPATGSAAVCGKSPAWSSRARPGADLDYVLVGRQAALARDFAALRQELQEALKRLKALAARDAMTCP